MDKIYLGIVTHHFSHISIKVMALDLRQNLAFLVSTLTEGLTNQNKNPGLGAKISQVVSYFVK